ncbi:putative F-box protein PP2-A13-like [Capsicum annuum]|nr:putative F-box protein PP2-A13-like [Capsicum annuum]
MYFPLLRSNDNDESFHIRSTHRHSFRHAIHVFQRASNRTGLMMREPSDQHDDQQSNWAYSKPVVIIDVVWYFMYVIAAILVLVLSRNENPEMPLRVWIVGYSLLCLLHVVCVLLEYKRRGYGRSSFAGEGFGNSNEGSSSYVTLAELTPERTSFDMLILEPRVYQKHPLYLPRWGKRMVEESPQLYWLCIVFLAFDVFFVVFLLVMACVIGIGLCCCLPCIIAVMYAVSDKTGADKEDIEQLSKYTFRHNGCTENCTGEVQGTFGGFMTLCGRDTPTEHERALSIDDAVCSLAFLSFDLVLVYSDIYFWQNVLIACPFVVNRDVPYVCLLMMTEMNFVNFPVVTFFTALVSINGYI